MAAAALCVVGLAIALMAQLYFRFMSQQIYEECANHLVEVYSQVNHNFVSFLEKNWGNLDDWVHHIQIEDEEGVLTFLHGRQQNLKCYKQDMGTAVQKLFQGEVDAAGCVTLMDEYRIATARELGAEGF